jgi:hypothetical protein
MASQAPGYLIIARTMKCPSRYITAAAASLLVACASVPPPSPAPAAPIEPPRAAREGPTPKGQRDLEVLVSFFTGTWDSKPGEPPMRLRVAPFRKGAPVRWLYLEWVRPSEEGKPVRQLVLRVAEDGEDLMTATVHRLPGDASRFAEEWRKPEPLSGVPIEELRAVAGCRLRVVRAMTAHFTLVTEGNRCPGDVPGSPAMRFEFSLTSSELDLLEQPRDAAGNVPPKSRLEPYRYGRSSRVPR